MEFTIHVQVTGLDRLADGLTALAGAAKAAAFHPVTNPAAISSAPAPAAPMRNPAAMAKGAPVNVAPQPNAMPGPSQAPGGTIPAGGMGSPAANAGGSAYAAPFAAASGSTAGTATAPNQAPGPVASANPAPAAQAGARSYTRDEIAQPAAAWCYADPAKTAERSAALAALNAEFGVMGLDQLPPEQYGAYALRLRQLGVAI